MDNLVIAALCTAFGAVLIEVVRLVGGRSSRSVDDSISFRKDLLERIDKLEDDLSQDEKDKEVLRSKYYRILVDLNNNLNHVTMLEAYYDQLNRHVDELYVSVFKQLKAQGLDLQILLADVKTPRPPKVSILTSLNQMNALTTESEEVKS